MKKHFGLISFGNLDYADLVVCGIIQIDSSDSFGVLRKPIFFPFLYATRSTTEYNLDCLQFFCFFTKERSSKNCRSHSSLVVCYFLWVICILFFSHLIRKVYLFCTSDKRLWLFNFTLVRNIQLSVPVMRSKTNIRALNF